MPMTVEMKLTVEAPARLKMAIQRRARRIARQIEKEFSDVTITIDEDSYAWEPG